MILRTLAAGATEALGLIIVANVAYNRKKLTTAILFSAVACLSCSDSPRVLNSHPYKSPNAKWVATLEEVDNGLGFGLGAVYDEVHLTEQREAIGRPGDPGTSVSSTLSRLMAKGTL